MCFYASVTLDVKLIPLVYDKVFFVLKYCQVQNIS